MKIAEFLEKLSKTPRKWRLEGTAIRCESGLCPVEAVAGTGPMSAYGRGGPKLGIPRYIIVRIVCGADDLTPRHSLWRKRLLKACDLK